MRGVGGGESLVRGLLPLLAGALATLPARPQSLEELAAPREDGPAELPEGFADQIIARGITGATGLAVAPDGRLFVCEQTGALRVIEGHRLLPEPALALEVDSAWERGLLGVALDPDFSSNHRLYVLYVAPRPYPHHRVSRFTLEGNRAVAGSEAVLLEGDDQSRLGGSIPAGHQGGGIHFGKDGKLYLGIGEQTAGAPAQRLDTFQGKILRLEPDGSIPSDNPFVGQASGKYRAIWAYGLRNPFGFDVEPRTGRLFINDVGGSRWEEINEGAAGANYGWPQTEGPTTDAHFRSPLHAYGESPTQSITAGAFYDPAAPQFPAEYRGRYFFADYLQRWIRVLDPARPREAREFGRGLAGPVALRVGPDGSLYCLVRNVWVKDARFRTGTGSVHRFIHLRGSGEPGPLVTAHPRDVAMAAGQEAGLAAAAEGAPPLRYQWQRNGREVPGATSASVSITGAPGDDGSLWRCVVSNRHGAAVSRPATVRVIPLHAAVSEAAAEPARAEGLLREEYRTGEGILIPDPGRRIAATTVGGFDLSSPAEGAGSGFSFRGFLEVERDGAYAFELASGGWAKLFVASTAVAGTGWPNGPRRASGAVGLRAGRHRLRLDCIPGPESSLEVLWSGPGFSLQSIPRARLSQPVPGNGPDLPAPRELVTTLNVPERADDLPPLLSQTGVFRALGDLTPAPGLVSYRVNSPLWSDGAAKSRWMALPGDARIGFSATGGWTFPPGTVFVKHFELAGGGKDGSARRLETRLLVVGPSGNGWGATYRWRPDGSDAELLRGPMDEAPVWYYPSPADCLVCHTANAGFVLGVNTRQLNREVVPSPSAVAGNQLRAWVRAGLFRDPPEESEIPELPRLAALDDREAPIESRARSYLDANCSHCHRPGGVRAEFDARFSMPFAQQRLLGGNLIGADLAIPGARVIVPGDRSRSMAFLRMNRRLDVFNMPPLASLSVDREAVEVMGAWIDSLAEGRRGGE